MYFIYQPAGSMRWVPVSGWRRSSRLRIPLTGSMTGTGWMKRENPRELHTELALEAIDFEAYPSYRTNYPRVENKTVTLVENNHFTTNLIALDKPLEKDYTHFDCFVIYLCVEGAFKLVHDGGTEDVGDR